MAYTGRYGQSDDFRLGMVNQHKHLLKSGDQCHQGRHARISVGEWKNLHIQLYEYK